MWPRLWLWSLFVAIVFAACGGGTRTALDAPPSATPSATPLAPPATPTPLPTSAPTPTAVVTEKPKCPDPYPGGAPFETEPDEPVRLRPTGTPPALARYSPLPFTRDPALERLVRETLGTDRPHFAVVVKNLADGRGAMLAPDRTFYAASLFKPWVMLEAFHQREAGLLSFNERYIVADYYAQFSLNPGELAPCERVSVRRALERMMAVSDNVAANLLLDRVGPANVNAVLASLGLRATSIPVDGSLPTTARDLALLFEALARRRVVSPTASEEMLTLLLSEAVNDRLPVLLPPGTPVAHKTGNWVNATHDAGIVFSPGATYVIVVLSDLGFEEDGVTPIARLSRAVYDYFNP